MGWSAACGDVEYDRSRFTGELQGCSAQAFQLAMGGVMGEGAAVCIAEFLAFALLTGIRHTLLVVVDAQVGP